MQDNNSNPNGGPSRISLSKIKEEVQANSNIPLDRGIIPTTEGDLDYKPLNRFDRGLVRGMDQNEIRAANQSNWGAVGNSLINIIPTVIGQTLEGAGYLGEIPELIVGSHDDFGNALSELGANIADDQWLPVHVSKSAQEGSPFTHFFNGEWWANNIPSIASAISLMLPAYGAVRAGTLGLRSLGKAARITGRTKKIEQALANTLFTGKNTAKNVAKLQNKASAISTALVSRHMENMMEAKGTFDEKYEEFRQQGMTEPQAREAAGEFAANHYKAGYLALMTEIPQYLMSFGALKPFGKAVKNLATQMGTEGVEEALQYIIAEESKRYTEAPDQYSLKVGRYLDDPELQTSAFFGGLGGGVFHMFGEGARDFQDAIVGKFSKVLSAKDPKEQATKNIIETAAEDGDYQGTAETVENLGAQHEDPQEVENVKEAVNTAKQADEQHSEHPEKKAIVVNAAMNLWNTREAERMHNKTQEFIANLDNQEGVQYHLLKAKKAELEDTLNQKISKFEKRAAKDLLAQINKSLKEYEQKDDFDSKINTSHPDWISAERYARYEMQKRVAAGSAHYQKEAKIKGTEKEEFENISNNEFQEQLGKAKTFDQFESLAQKHPDKAGEVKAVRNKNILKDEANVDMRNYDTFEEYYNELSKQPFIRTMPESMLQLHRSKQLKAWNASKDTKTESAPPLRRVGNIVETKDGKQWRITSVDKKGVYTANSLETTEDGYPKVKNKTFTDSYIKDDLPEPKTKTGANPENVADSTNPKSVEKVPEKKLEDELPQTEEEAEEVLFSLNTQTGEVTEPEPVNNDSLNTVDDYINAEKVPLSEIKTVGDLLPHIDFLPEHKEFLYFMPAPFNIKVNIENDRGGLGYVGDFNLREEQLGEGMETFWISGEIKYTGIPSSEVFMHELLHYFTIPAMIAYKRNPSGTGNGNMFVKELNKLYEEAKSKGYSPINGVSIHDNLNEFAVNITNLESIEQLRDIDLYDKVSDLIYDYLKSLTPKSTPKITTQVEGKDTSDDFLDAVSRNEIERKLKISLDDYIIHNITDTGELTYSKALTNIDNEGKEIPQNYQIFLKAGYDLGDGYFAIGHKRKASNDKITFRIFKKGTPEYLVNAWVREDGEFLSETKEAIKHRLEIFSSHLLKEASVIVDKVAILEKKYNEANDFLDAVEAVQKDIDKKIYAPQIGDKVKLLTKIGKEKNQEGEIVEIRDNGQVKVKGTNFKGSRIVNPENVGLIQSKKEEPSQPEKETPVTKTAKSESPAISETEPGEEIMVIDKRFQKGDLIYGPDGLPLDDGFVDQLGIDQEFIRGLHEHGDPYEMTVVFEVDTSMDWNSESNPKLNKSTLNILAVTYVKGERKILGQVRSEGGALTSRLREELWNKFKANPNEPIIQSNGTALLSTIMPGRHYTVKGKRKTTLDVLQEQKVKVFAVAIPQSDGSYNLVHSPLPEGVYPEKLSIGADNTLDAGEANFFTLVQDTSGRWKWARVFERNVEDIPELEQELRGLLGNIEEISKRANELGLTNMEQAEKSEDPVIQKWLRDATDIRNKVRSIVKFKTVNKKGDAHIRPDFDANLIFVKTYHDNGVFSTKKFLDQFNILSRPAQVDKSRLSDPAYLETALTRTESDLHPGKYKFVTPKFYFDNYTVPEKEDVTSEEKKTNKGEVDLDLSSMFKKVKDDKNHVLDIEQAKKDLRSLLGDFPMQIIDNLIDVGSFQAYAVAKQAMIVMSRLAPNKAIFHEAFHIVFRGILNDSQRQELYNAAKERYNITSEDLLDAEATLKFLKEKYEGVTLTAEQVALEEKMADEFENYRIKATGVKGILKRFFRMLNNFIKKITGHFDAVDRIFRDINAGKYRNGIVGKLTPAYQAVELDQREIKDVLSSGLAFFEASVKKDYEENIDFLLDVYSDSLSEDPDKDLFTSTTIPNSVLNKLTKWLQIKENPEAALKIAKMIRPDIQEIIFNDGHAVNEYVTEGNPIKGPMYIEFLKGLASRGFSISLETFNVEEVNSLDDTDINDEDNLNEVREYWQENRAKISPKESVTYDIKRALSVIYKGEGAYGLPVFYNPNELYPELQRTAGGSPNIDAMMEKIRKHPVLGEQDSGSSLWKMLESWESDYKANRLAVQIWKAIGQQKHSKRHAVVYLTSYDSKGEPAVQPVLLQSNRNSLDSFIKNQIEQLVQEDEPSIFALSMPISLRDKLENDRGFRTMAQNEYTKAKNTRRNTKDANEYRYAYKKLIDIIKPYYMQSFQDSSYTVDGEKVYEWGSPGFINKLFAAIQDNPTRQREFYEQDPLYGGMPIWDYIRDMDIFELEGLKEFNRSKGIGFDRFSSSDHWNVLLAAFHNAGNEKAGISMPIYSDAPVTEFVKVPKLSVSQLRTGIQWLLDFEANRNKQGDLNDKASDKYISNQNRRLLIPEEMGDTAQQVIEKIREQASDFYNQIKDDPSIKLHEDIKDPLKFLENFFATHMVVQGQMILLGTGDPAFYKQGKDSSIIDDFFKRAKELHSPRTYGSTKAFWKSSLTGEEVKPPEVFEVSVFPDIETDAPQLEDLVKILGGDIGDYKGKNSLTDGQTFLSPHSYRNRQIILQEWNDAKEMVFQHLIKGKLPTSKEFKRIIKALPKKSPVRKKLSKIKSFETYKPYYYNLAMIDILKDKKTHRATPVQKKDSESLIIPFYALETVNGKANPLYNPFVKKLFEKEGYKFNEDGTVDASGIDQRVDRGTFTFDSTLKTYIPQITQKGEEIESNPGDPVTIELSYNEWGKQQEVPEHFFNHGELFGSQIMKLIISDIKAIPGNEEIVKKYQSLIIDNIKRDYSFLADKFDDWDGLLNMLREEVINRKLGNDYLKALEVDEIETQKQGKTVTKLALWHPLHSYRIESLLNSMFKKGVTKQKFTNGFSLVNKSAVGLKRKPRIVFKYDENDNPVAIDHIEAIIPITHPDIMRFVNQDGFIDAEAFEKIPEEYKQAIAYRIPTEYKYSMFKIRVIAFDPFSDSIVLPHEITVISGLDFDIDKVKGFYKARVPKLATIAAKFPEGKEVLDKYKFVLDPLFKEFDESALLDEEEVNDLVDFLADEEPGTEYYEQSRKALMANMDNEAILNEIKTVLEQRREELFKIPQVKKEYNQTKDKINNDNALFDLMWNDILGHPSQMKKQLKPGGFERMKKLAKRFEQKSTTNLLDPRTTVDIAQRMNTGKALVGMSAIYNSAKALWQHYKLSMPNGFIIDDVNYKDLSQIDSTEEFSIVQNIAETLAAFVDNGKFPLAEIFNMNLLTADTFLSMLAAGVPFEKTVEFIAHDAVREVTNFAANRKMKLDEALAEFKTSLKRNEVPDGIRFDKDTGKILNSNEDIRKHLLYFFNLSTDIATLVRATRIGDKGAGPTLANNLAKEEIMTKAYNINAYKVRISGLENMLLDPNFYMRSLYNLGIHQATVDLINKLDFPNLHGSGFAAIMNKFRSLDDTKTLGEDQIEMLYRQYMEYNAADFIDVTKFDPFDLEIAALKKKYPDNTLLRRLSQNDKTGVINFDAVTGMDDSEVNLIKQSWRELPYNIQIKLRNYAFHSGGFRFTQKGFSHMQPVELYLDKELERMLKDNFKVTFDEENKHVDVFFEQFVRNNFRNISSIPYINPGERQNRIMVKGKDGLYTMKGDPNKNNVPYIKSYVNNKDGWKLLKYNVDTNVYYEIPTLGMYVGKNKVFQEYYFYDGTQETEFPISRFDKPFNPPKEHTIARFGITYRVNKNMRTKSGRKVLAKTTTDTNIIYINPVESVEEFFEYFEGKVDSITSAQKAKVLVKMEERGWPLDKIKSVIKTPLDANLFLILHEQDHVEHGDSDVYFKDGDDLLTPDKIEIETRASINALEKMLSENRAATPAVKPSEVKPKEEKREVQKEPENPEQSEQASESPALPSDISSTFDSVLEKYKDAIDAYNKEASAIGTLNPETIQWMRENRTPEQLEEFIKKCVAK